MPASDEKLMTQYQDGDYDAFCLLYERYHKRVFGYVRRKVADHGRAEEIFQMIFLRLHKSRHQYNAALPLAPWLFTISRTVLIDEMRRRREEVCNTDIEAIPAQPVVEPLANLSLESLQLEQAQLLQLRYGDGLSFEQISVRLKASPQTIRKRVSRITAQLRNLFAPKEQVE
ncbi:MAG: sigma-70 family RNA polymerase sigma factor [Deltaproteobacteria bacterium]|nr:sigma-70 family RNA polymerase sigma factor [Deltaproteobacteria bacterium]